MSDSLPAATIYQVKQTPLATIHSLVSPASMLANATHIIELATQLILVDGQFFAQYGQEFRALADSLGKPITRYYISHDHPDHYLGMGDAFADVPVYALAETQASIAADGPQVLAARQASFGPLVAASLKVPDHVVTPGTEVIDGVTFVFEAVHDLESPVALTIKLPELGVFVAQDIIYNETHLFLTGPTAPWRAALHEVAALEGYDTVLPGHGPPTTTAAATRALAYLDTAEALLHAGLDAATYKERLLAAYPTYAGDRLIDIYLPILFPSAGAAAAE